MSDVVRGLVAAAPLILAVVALVGLACAGVYLQERGLDQEVDR